MTTITETAGLRLPIKSFNLAAFVSEPVKPLIDVIVNCPDLGVYLNQSDKGELVIGGAPDPGQSFRRDVNKNVLKKPLSPCWNYSQHSAAKIAVNGAVSWTCT